MKRPVSNGALGAVTVATILVVVLLVSPASATQNPPTKVGSQVVANTYVSGVQRWPDTAHRPDGKWIVVWSSFKQDGSGTGIYMQLYNADRTPFGAEVRVHTNGAGSQDRPKVAAAADNSFVVVWQSRHTNTNTIQSQRFDSSGSPLGVEFGVSTGTGDAYDPDVTYLTNGNVVYCWRDNSVAPDRIMIRRYSPSFNPLGIEEVNHPSQSAHNNPWPSIAPLPNGRFVVAYHGYHVGSSGTEIRAQIYNSDGTTVGALIQVNSVTYVTQKQPKVAALPDGGFIVTWESGHVAFHPMIMARHFAADGTPVGDDFVVNTVDLSGFTSDGAYYPSVATFSDHSFVIAWRRGNDKIAMEQFDAAHNKVGSEIVVNSGGPNLNFPSVASSWVDGGFVVFYESVVWDNYDIAGQWFAADVVPAPQVTTPCTSACLRYFCTEGQIVSTVVTGVVSNDVWGSQYFSDDSNLAAAAVFAGLVSSGETATVTVKCSGPKASFSGSSANGVTTQAFAEPWPASFTFDLGGVTLAPPAPSPARCFTEPCAHGKCLVQGATFDITVMGVVSNDVWGTEQYSDDSWVGSAAVHQGILQVGSVGSVTVSCTGPRASLTGSPRNGVTSNSFGPWPFTYVVHAGPTAAPAPTTDMCVGACLERNCPENRELYVRVFGSVSGYGWGGSAAYTEDTTVALAAVHSGIVSAGATAIVKATCKGAQTAFTGSAEHGVTTSSFGPWTASFELSAGTGMPTVACGAGQQCLKDECSVRGRVIKLSVTGSTHSATVFWGTTLYGGDSPPSHAAVHAGLIQDGQTAVLYATCQGPHDSFSGTTANGVTSTAWNAPWPGSFTLSASL